MSAGVVIVRAGPADADAIARSPVCEPSGPAIRRWVAGNMKT